MVVHQFHSVLEDSLYYQAVEFRQGQKHGLKGMHCFSQGVVLLKFQTELEVIICLTHLAPDQLLPFRYEIPCEGK